MRALAVLAGIWGLLALVAFTAGVLPTFERAAPNENGEDDDHDTAVAPEGDAGPRSAADAGTTGAETEDEGTTPAEPPRARRAAVAFATCRGATSPPVGRALQVFGDSRPELVVACGRQASIFALGGDDLAPTRVAILEATGASDAPDAVPPAVEVGPPAALDVDGDALPDLVIPVTETADAATRGGAVFFVPRESAGGLGSASRIAPVASIGVALAQLDAREGTDVLVLTTGSAAARRPSEVWVFAGGASPARIATTRAAVGGRSIATADMDRDGHEDALVAASEGAGLVILFGDGTGRFPRRADIALPDASEVVTGDVDGDGSPDAVIRANGVHLLLAGPLESLVPRPLHATDIADLELFDVDADRAREVVGIDGSRVVYFETAEGESDEEHTLVELAGAVPQRASLADFDGDGKLDLVVMASADDGTPFLVPISDVRSVGAVDVDAGAAVAIPDAPLTLTIPLR